jgi:PKD repeat protein
MKLDFAIYAAETVPENYSWDKGKPLEGIGNTVQIFPEISNYNYVSGYAPALKVYFNNESVILNKINDLSDFEWNFGDYYNDSSNQISLSCVSSIEHTYVMPGIYTVYLKTIKSTRSEEFDKTGNSLLCKGKYDYRWFWDETNIEKETAKTWDQTNKGYSFEKTWDDEVQCFEKHCKIWSWDNLSTNAGNPVKWEDAASDAKYVKKWYYQPNDTICKVGDADFLTTENITEQTVIKTNVIEVKEIPPIAYINSITNPLTGYSPYNIQLSPRHCKCGSFPIDRIDWDFGDGSPIITVSRYTVLTGANFIYNEAFPLDSLDVRNYDVIHSYKRTRKNYPVFYPSLSCYSANTSTHDSCSMPVGPIIFPTISDKITLLKNRNTLKGNLYSVTVDDNISFLTSETNNDLIFNNTPPQPSNDIKNFYTFSEQEFYGNNGEGFPGEYVPDCNKFTLIVPLSYVTTEDSTPTITTDALSATIGEPILSETNLTFIP